MEEKKSFDIGEQSAMYGGTIINMIINGDKAINICCNQTEQRSIYSENGCDFIIDDNSFDALIGYFLSDDKENYKITVRNASSGEPINGLTRAVKLFLNDLTNGSFLNGRIVECFLKTERGYKRYADMTIPFRDKCSNLDLRIKVIYGLLLMDKICNARKQIDKEDKIEMRVFFSHENNFRFYIYVDETKLRQICDERAALNFDNIMNCINDDYAMDFGEEFITDEVLPHYYLWLGFMDEEKYKSVPDVLNFSNFKIERIKGN